MIVGEPDAVIAGWEAVVLGVALRDYQRGHGFVRLPADELALIDRAIGELEARRAREEFVGPSEIAGTMSRRGRSRELANEAAVGKATLVSGHSGNVVVPDASAPTTDGLVCPGIARSRYLNLGH